MKFLLFVGGLQGCTYRTWGPEGNQAWQDFECLGVLASPGANFLGRCFCLFLSGNVNNIWKLIKQRHYDCRQIWSLAHIRLNTHNPKPCVAIRNPVMTKACVYTYIYIYDYIYICVCVYMIDICVCVGSFVYLSIYSCVWRGQKRPTSMSLWVFRFSDLRLHQMLGKDSALCILPKSFDTARAER